MRTKDKTPSVDELRSELLKLRAGIQVADDLYQKVKKELSGIDLGVSRIKKLREKLKLLKKIKALKKRVSVLNGKQGLNSSSLKNNMPESHE